MKRIPIYVPEEHHEQIRVLAFKHKVSMAEEIRRAIESHLNHHGERMGIEYHLDFSNVLHEFKLEEGDEK